MGKEFIDKIAWILIHDRKMLVGKNRGKDVWLTPGGKRELGESDEATLQREIMEEYTVALDPSTITYFGTFEAQAHGKPEGVMVRITCYTADYKGKLTPSDEVETMGWIDSTETNVTVTGREILDALKAKDLID